MSEISIPFAILDLFAFDAYALYWLYNKVKKDRELTAKAVYWKLITGV